MELRIEIHNNRSLIYGYTSEDDRAEVYAEAIRSLALRQGRKYFLGSSLSFIIPTGDGGYTRHTMRENWNGWHDFCQVYPDGSIRYPSPAYADPSAGRHRVSL